MRYNMILLYRKIWIVFVSSVLIAVSIGYMNTAFAQKHCVPAQTLQRNAAQSYLIRLTEIGHTPVDGRSYAGSRIDTRGARFEVLKVYSGNVDELFMLGNAMLVINCGQQWNLQCSILEEHNYPFYEGQMFIIYDKPDTDGIVTIKIGPCPGSKRFINNESELEEFEHRYPPIWVSPLWERAHPQSLEDKLQESDVDGSVKDDTM